MGLKQEIRDGMFGFIIGDALGVPVEGMSREEIASRPQGKVADMEGYGTYNKPAGTWSDDTSLSLATIDSLFIVERVSCEDIMSRFIDWLAQGKYAVDGEVFDMGKTCASSILRYGIEGGINNCGETGEYANGNGALMRILPVCIYLAGNPIEEAIEKVEQVSALTHNHIRSKIACGIYYFIVNELIESRERKKEQFAEVIQAGVEKAFIYYGKKVNYIEELENYDELLDIDTLASYEENEIESSGYVVDTLIAAVWSCIRTNSYKDCVLQAVNLGMDSDTTAAIAGGLAGLYYGIKGIPGNWIKGLRGMEEMEVLFID